LCVAAAVSGVLKGYDQLLNVVLDEAVEYLRGKKQQLLSDESEDISSTSCG
jgi:small nuclear ribonucleoprotein (snRNP)-like protein